MPLFTLITESHDSFHVSQHTAATPAEALSEHVARLPYHDSIGPHDDELAWLQSVAGGKIEIKLIELNSCRNTWLWLDGSRNVPQYITYIVATASEGS